MRVRIFSELARYANESVLDDGVAYESYPTVEWEGDVEVSGVNDDMYLSDLFRSFNRVHEDDEARLEELGYRLPSMSVGDIVTLDVGAANQRMYRVGPVGFTHLGSGVMV